MENKENGKTYSAINFLINQKLAHNYRIITNVHSFNIFNDSIFMDKIEDIIKYCTSFKDNDENVIIFFDEIFTILEKNTRINKNILSFISQLRKRKIIFITTAQEWAEINITFRRYCRYQIDCNMFAIPFLILLLFLILLMMVTRLSGIMTNKNLLLLVFLLILVKVNCLLLSHMILMKQLMYLNPRVDNQFLID